MTRYNQNGTLRKPYKTDEKKDFVSNIKERVRHDFRLGQITGLQLLYSSLTSNPGL